MPDGAAVALIIALALAFDFTNGFHDAANAIATTVSTRALSPRLALGMSALLNLAGAFLTTAVAATVGKGIVVTSAISLPIVGAALVGAIVWNLFTWRLGLPSSSSHALIGGLVGAMLSAHGSAFVQWKNIWLKVGVPGLLSPLAGFACGFLVMLALYWLFRRWSPKRINRTFRRLQVVSAAFVSFSHGANDAQKTMGVVTLALVAGHYQRSFAVQPWVIVLSAGAIALGTYSGGWRIIRTVGQRIIRLEPINGFAAEASSATVLLVASFQGLPVSTTHVVSGAIMGVGSTRNLSAVRWGVAGNILLAWLLTLPCAAAVAALVYAAAHLLGAQ
ncbi:MAG TPA: inorganic phosphate transporter [Chloroflexota bacterium]|jgi:PiT family inorganic phosphate transporter|nr:inorganic phosphate transporter [Chloroflexota bacterium]